MTRNTHSIAMVALFGLVLAGCGGGDKEAETASNASDAPSAVATKAPSLASLAEDGPVFLYFAKRDCGSNSRAIPLVQSVYEPYAGKVKMYAVVNTSNDDYEGWSKKFGVTMPGLSDEDLALTKQMGFAESQHLVLVEKGGKAQEIEGGYGREALVALNQALAKEAGEDPAEIDLSGAPSRKAYG